MRAWILVGLEDPRVSGPGRESVVRASFFPSSDVIEWMMFFVLAYWVCFCALSVCFK